MTTYVIPYRIGGKTRLGDPELAQAMLSDVTDAVQRVADDAVVVDSPGGQGEALAASLAVLRGAVTIVNADLPCVTSDELEQLSASAPALVEAVDGTTNAIALRDVDDFMPLYGAGSAERFAAHLGAVRLELPGLRDDVDTWEDVERVRDRVGKHTGRYLKRLMRG